MANALLAPTEARIVAANQHGQQQMRDCEFDQMRWDVAVRKPGADREHVVGSIQPIEPFAIARRRIAPALRPPRIRLGVAATRGAAA